MELSEAILNEWKKQAESDGLLEEYEYHLGMIYPPLPYRLWKIKYAELQKIQSATDYLDNTRTMPRETALCNELGY